LVRTRRRNLGVVVKVDGRGAARVLAEEAADVGDAVQRHAHADHELAGRDIHAADPLGHRVLHLRK
jgi:hypothetical protein